MNPRAQRKYEPIDTEYSGQEGSARTVLTDRYVGVWTGWLRTYCMSLTGQRREGVGWLHTDSIKIQVWRSVDRMAPYTLYEDSVGRMAQTV
jgi:hypothetical protein